MSNNQELFPQIYQQLLRLFDDLSSQYNRQNAIDLLEVIRDSNNGNLSGKVAQTILDNLSRNRFDISEQQLRALTFGVIYGRIDLNDY